ncbi:type VI secretion system lipoprotein TssJ [Serratia sp. S1B]|nr:type VI secretion system lipoprotein TssJ [Serratia sp. S1B]
MFQLHKLNTWLVLFFTLALSACGVSGERQKPHSPVELILSATKDSNPTHDGRAAPVLVTVYTLSSADNFKNSDFYTISAGSNPALQEEIKKQKQLILKPGESRTLKIDIDSDIAYLGVVAAYRNINDAHWSAIYTFKEAEPRRWYQKIVPHSENALKLSVELNKLSVSIKEVN